MPNIVARVPYAKRQPPKDYNQGFLNTELGNLQRAIPPQRVRLAIADDIPTSQDFTVLYDASAGPISVTLPSPDQVQWLLLNLKKIDASANAVTIVGTIDGVVNPTLATQYKSKTIQSDGTTYYTLASV